MRKNKNNYTISIYKNNFNLLFLILFSLWAIVFYSSSVFSQISINLLSKNEYKSLSVEAVSKELSLRTSINNLSYIIDKSSEFDKFKYQPLMWVDSSLLIKDSSGVLKKDI